MTQLADERLIATLCDWWREGPVPEADAVIDDCFRRSTARKWITWAAGRPS